MYISQHAFKLLIIDVKKTDIFSENLKEVLDQMISGIFQRYHAGDVLEYDDYYQECWLKFLKIYQKINLSKNIFSYLTTTFLNVFRKEILKTNRKVQTLTDLPDMSGSSVDYRDVIKKRWTDWYNTYVVIDNRRQNIQDWCLEKKINYRSVILRIRKGMSPIDAILTPFRVNI